MTSQADEQAPLDTIICRGCGRYFRTLDGPRMIDAITGRCPDCGSAFELRSAADRDLDTAQAGRA